MTDFHARIAEKQQHAEQLRRQALPPLADALVLAAAEWASGLWERIIRDEIDRDPAVARLNRDSLPSLKTALADLRVRLADETLRHLEPIFLHRIHSDDEIATWANTNMNWDTATIQVSLPTDDLMTGEEPFRRLAGALGPAMAKAGLLSDKCPVTTDGRYARGLAKAHPVNEALRKYQDGVRALAVSLVEVKRLCTERDQADAQALWDEA